MTEPMTVGDAMRAFEIGAITRTELRKILDRGLGGEWWHDQPHTPKPQPPYTLIPCDGSTSTASVGWVQTYGKVVA